MTFIAYLTRFCFSHPFKNPHRVLTDPWEFMSVPIPIPYPWEFHRNLHTHRPRQPCRVGVDRHSVRERLMRHVLMTGSWRHVISTSISTSINNCTLHRDSTCCILEHHITPAVVAYNVSRENVPTNFGPYFCQIGPIDRFSKIFSWHSVENLQ